MTNNPQSPASILGTELTDALDRSMQTSLSSLVSLRLAVRSYTIHNRDRGVSMETLLKSALNVLTEAEDDRGAFTDSYPVRDSELARHLAAWCHEDFKAHA